MAAVLCPPSHHLCLLVSVGGLGLLDDRDGTDAISHLESEIYRPGRAEQRFAGDRGNRAPSRRREAARYDLASASRRTSLSASERAEKPASAHQVCE